MTNLSTRKIPYDEPNANEICVALSGENRSTTSTRSTTLDVTPDTDWVEGLFQ